VVLLDELRVRALLDRPLEAVAEALAVIRPSCRQTAAASPTPAA